MASRVALKAKAKPSPKKFWSKAEKAYDRNRVPGEKRAPGPKSPRQPKGPRWSKAERNWEHRIPGPKASPSILKSLKLAGRKRGIAARGK
jgi:hypothetical protein